MTVLTLTKYQSNEGSIHSIRLRSATVTLAGTAPAGDVDSNVPAKVSKSNGEFGVRPRGVRISRIVGTGAAAFREYAFIPVLTPTAWGALSEQDTVTYNGGTWTIVRKVNEDL